MLLREQNVCLNVGNLAPDIELPDQYDNSVRLSDYRGKMNVLIVLHPGKLNSSCKEHFKFYETHHSDFTALKAQVLAVNMDSVMANRKWSREVGGLSFPLLSDYRPLGDITLKYDCFVPKQGYGKRAVFVVDKRGILRYVEVLKAEGNACPNMDQILQILANLD
ncbi:MAG: redoxin domain-containing protein [Candidatus Thorarchaeota archaeon]|jgi:peroxiredoxin (alkyl hydroperoxide reductase subunit C)